MIGAVVPGRGCGHPSEAVVIGGGPLGEAARDLQGACTVPIVQPIPAAISRLVALIEA